MTDFPALEDASYEATRKDYDSDSQTRQHATADSWRKSTRLDKARKLRRALTHQRRLEIASKRLTALASSQQPGGTVVDLNGLAQEIVSSTAGLNDLLAHLAAPRLFNERRAATDCASRRVFDIPELLERILTFVDTRDLLQVQQVDWTMYHMIEKSLILQRAMHLQPSATGFLITPFVAAARPASLKPPRDPSPNLFPGFTCVHAPTHWTYDNTTSTNIATPGKITICAKFTNSRLPTIGARCRRMLICEPPIYEMQVYPSCCSVNPFDIKPYSHCTITHHPRPLPTLFVPGQADVLDALRPLTGIITSTTGLTIGDLLDAALRVQREHILCPFACPWFHNAAGEVIPFVSFGGISWLKPEDPTHPSHPLDAISQVGPPPNDTAFEAKLKKDQSMHRYVQAKQQALIEGRVIPTYKEFKQIDEVS